MGSKNLYLYKYYINFWNFWNFRRKKTLIIGENGSLLKRNLILLLRKRYRILISRNILLIKRIYIKTGRIILLIFGTVNQTYINWRKVVRRVPLYYSCKISRIIIISALFWVVKLTRSGSWTFISWNQSNKNRVNSFSRFFLYRKLNNENCDNVENNNIISENKQIKFNNKKICNAGCVERNIAGGLSVIISNNKFSIIFLCE